MGEANLKQKKKRRAQSTQATQSSLRLVLCSLPLCRAEVGALLRPHCSSRDAFAPPPENQRDHEQHKEYKEESFAMSADAAATPPNPKIAATSAMIRKTTAHPNIRTPPHRLNRICRLGRVPLHPCSRSNIRSDFNELPQLETSVLTRPASRGATR